MIIHVFTTAGQIQNETKIKTSLRARGPPGVSGGPTQLAYSAYREDRLWRSSHCRLKWPKSDFFAQMWPISDFLMKVWTAQIRFFQIRPRPLSYMILNRIHIRCFAMRLQSERPCHISCDFYVIEMRQTSQFCAGGGGKIKITMADNIYRQYYHFVI